jgi:hypothetical protein
MQARRNKHYTAGGDAEPLMTLDKATTDTLIDASVSASEIRPQVEYSYRPQYPRRGAERYVLGVLRDTKQVGLTGFVSGPSSETVNVGLVTPPPSSRRYSSTRSGSRDARPRHKKNGGSRQGRAAWHNKSYRPYDDSDADRAGDD